MESTLVSKVNFYLRTFQYRVGNLGVLGLLMLVVAPVAYLSLALPQARQLHSAEVAYAKLSTLHVQLVTQKTSQSLFRPDEFFRQFPRDTQKETALKSIVAIAERNTLALDAGKYETLTKESGLVVFYQINFPLKGTYPKIKQFLAETLNTLPNAALSEILFHHTSIESNQVEADVVFTLYFTKVH